MFLFKAFMNHVIPGGLSRLTPQEVGLGQSFHVVRFKTFMVRRDFHNITLYSFFLQHTANQPEGPEVLGEKKAQLMKNLSKKNQQLWSALEVQSMASDLELSSRCEATEAIW